MKPILFNTEMVRAILDGRKTQTRRVFTKKQVELFKYAIMDGELNSTLEDYNNEHWLWAKYRIGDILWVRETFVDALKFGFTYGIYYKATDEHIIKDKMKEWGIKWKPSIHMPKEAARIFLRVTNVRVERLQDISDEDILKEGIIDLESWVCGDIPEYQYCVTMKSKRYDSAEEAFKELWNSTAKESYKWEDNPYVFVYEFEKVDKPCD